MHILRVAQKLYPETKGGASYHIHALSRDQAAMGHDVTVLTVRQDPELPHTEKRDGYTLVRFDSAIAPLGNDVAPGVVQFLYGRDEFDVIHAHSHLYFSTNVAALKRRFDTTPLAITNHGLFSQSASERVFRWYLHSLGRWTFNQADVVFCYTPEDRERVQAFGVDSRIKVVANGIDTDRFTPDGPSSELIDHDGPVVLFVGRLVDGKRPQDAVEAVSQLPAEMNARLYIVGDGPMRAELEERADERVRFLGHVPYDEMPAIYRAGGILVLPSRAEGLPRTVLEAFASGIPVVSSRLEHTAPIVEEAGETVPVGDVDGYVGALEHVLDNAAEIGADGRETVTRDFRWQDSVEETTAVLESLR